MSLDDVFEELDKNKETKKPQTIQPQTNEPPTTTTPLTDEENHEPTPEESPPVEASTEEDNLWGEGKEFPSTPVPSQPPPTPQPSTTPTQPTPPVTPEPLVGKKVEELPSTKYDTSPDSGSPKRVYTIYALKGEGKTGLALSFEGNIAALSFDNKTVQVWEEMFNRATRIIVYDAIRYLNKASGELWLKSSDITIDYINTLLDTKIKAQQPDWILLDGSEILLVLCEMKMRFMNGLQPFQGIANRQIWKERRMYLDQIHKKCIDIAKQGVIYTSYVTQTQIVKEGSLVTVQDVPKWIDAQMLYTDVVVRVKSSQGDKGQGRIFTAIVESSKTKSISTGKVVDITGTEGYKKLRGG